MRAQELSPLNGQYSNAMTARFALERFIWKALAAHREAFVDQMNDEPPYG